MLHQLIVPLLKRETVLLRRRAASLALILAAAMIISVGAGFALLGAFLALSDVMAPWSAALIVGSATALLGLILLLSGRHRLRNRHARQSPIDATLQGLIGRPSGPGSPDDVPGPLGIVLSAALIGIILGEKLRK